MSSESAGHGGSCGVLVTTLEFVPSFWGPLHALEEGLEHVPRPLRRCDEGEATAQCEPPLAL